MARMARRTSSRQGGALRFPTRREAFGSVWGIARCRGCSVWRPAPPRARRSIDSRTTRASRNRSARVGAVRRDSGADQVVVVRTFSRTMRRAHSLRLFRRMREESSTYSVHRRGVRLTGVDRARLSIGRPNLIAVGALPGALFSRSHRPRYPRPHRAFSGHVLQSFGLPLHRHAGFKALPVAIDEATAEYGHRAYNGRHSRASLHRPRSRWRPTFLRGRHS